MRIAPEDIIVEVGPGKGALSKFLAPEAKHLIAIEIDGRLVDDLRAALPSERTTILHEDFLNISLADLSSKYQRKLRLAGNLPYHLTSAVFFKSLEEHDALFDMTVMVQREVAQRIAAKPSTKEYGILAVLAQFYGTPKYLFTVSPNCFFPKPKVESAIVNLRFHERNPFQIDEKIFTLLVKTSFGKRRKTLRNSLKFLPYEESQVEEIIRRAEKFSAKRPEQLTVAEFAELTSIVSEILT